MYAIIDELNIVKIKCNSEDNFDALYLRDYVCL